MFKDMKCKRMYRSDMNDNVALDFLVPLLENAKLYRRAVGYFSTTSLEMLSVGLAAMERNGGKIEVICSPKLSKEDIEAINLGYKTKEKAFVEALDVSLTNPIDEFAKERLNIVATLVANGVLNFKIAFMEDDNGINIYHEKFGIAYDEAGDRIAFSGSMNDSENGFENNFELITVFSDCNSAEQKEYVDEMESNFKRLLEDNTSKLKVIPFPKIIIDKLLAYRCGDIDYKVDEKQFGSGVNRLKKNVFIKIPDTIKLLDYQREAIINWKKQGFTGIYDMATGTGKTITALGSIEYLATELDNNVAVYIICPYIHLITQWEEDLVKWGTNPILAYGQSKDKEWYKHLIDANKRFKLLKKPYICITTNDTFKSEKFQNIFKKFTCDENILLVVDEAHNVGSKGMVECLNENIKYRLALSATIERHRDKSGTDAIFRYFKDRCIEYPLERAIEEGNLCQYEYHIIYSFLSDEELSEYIRITKEMSKCYVNKNGKRKLNEVGKLKAFQRRRIIAGAKDKIGLLKKYMEKYRDDSHILVYCGATKVIDENTDEEEKQILLVNKMIEDELGMSVHKFTADEDIYERETIKQCFDRGMYQVLTAIRCLDEGVNIPNIQKAFILASSQNPKEFIQRRGRLLRKAKGKNIAIIYDFITLPRAFSMIHSDNYEEDKGIIVGEMLRIQEFTKSAINKREGFDAIDTIQEAYNIYLDLDEEMERLKEEDTDE